jgi:tetratricopeptide (TPR) repeat protein
LRFSHAEIRTAFYQKLSPLERRRIHFEAGEVLERLYDGQKMAVAPLLAHHFLQADDYERVLTYGQVAAQQAELLQNSPLALTWYNIAWQAMTKLDLPTASKPEFELLLARERLYKRLGQQEEQKHTLTSLAELIQTLPTPDPKKQALVAHRWSAYQRLQHQWDAAQVEAQASLTAAQQANDPVLRGESLIQLGYLALAQEQFEVARKELDTAYTILSQARDHVGATRALNGLGMVCQSQNEFAQAEVYYQQALTLNQTTRNWANQAAALSHLGGLYLATKELAKAEIYSQRALELNRLINYPPGITHCAQTLSYIKATKGK